jgi:anti-anti-sigma factor
MSLTLNDEQFPGNLTVITVKGELDANTAGDFDALVTKLLGEGTSKLLVDIDGVTYIASAGVGVFVGNVQALRDRGGDLAIVYSKYVDPEDTGTGLTEGYNPLEVFDMLGLAEMLKIGRTRKEALALIAG